MGGAFLREVWALEVVICGTSGGQCSDILFEKEGYGLLGRKSCCAIFIIKPLCLV